MPQIGFFVGAAGVSFLNIPLGVAQLYIAWDQSNKGSSNPLGIVYKSIALASVTGAQKIATLRPFRVAHYAKPSFTSAFEPLGLDTVKFSLTTSTNFSDWVDITLEAYDDKGKKVYSASDSSLRVQIWGSFPASFTFAGSMEVDADYQKRRYDYLMTPNARSDAPSGPRSDALSGPRLTIHRCFRRWRNVVDWFK